MTKSNSRFQSLTNPALAWQLLLVLGVSAIFSGCAAITNPTANGIPVNRLPPELLELPSRDARFTIPLNLLSQRPPKEYILASKDVLGVFINGVLPAAPPDQPITDPPVYFPSQIDPLGAGLQPSLGFPIPVREDGTIALPLIEPLNVAGKSVTQASEMIRNAYVNRNLVKSGRERIIVTLMQPRQIRVMVVREEEGGFATGGRREIVGNIGKRGTGHLLDLRAYENDVLHALNTTGGLPGLDAYAEIVVFKGAMTAEEIHRMKQVGNVDPLSCCSQTPRIIRIPTRIQPNQPLPFRPEDILLDDGDIVLLESRPTEVFYTAGLLPSTMQELPRDRDVDVIQAIAMVAGPLQNGAIAGNNLTGVLVNDGLGNPSPKLLTVLRRTPDGGQVPIRVDLDRALTDARERILIRAEDVLLLQETPGQAMGRYFSQKFNLNSNLRILSRGSAAVTGAGITP